MNPLVTAVTVGALAVGVAWLDNTVIRPSDNELSHKTMIRFFIYGAIGGLVLALAGYGLFDFFSETDLVVADGVAGLKSETGVTGGTDGLEITMGSGMEDSLKIGRPSF